VAGVDRADRLGDAFRNLPSTIHGGALVLTGLNNAPMPHSIFYSGPFAIHGTTDVGHLGHPASHGCVRLHPNNAAVLFDLVQRQGARNTTVVVQ
jgi:lipoprotein-anchoring transpeptidase ErfK/SrfK